MTIRGEVLDDAKAAIEGDRNKDYGNPKDNFEDTADLWNVRFGHKLVEGFTAEDIATAMILVKVARTKVRSTRDSWQDIAGYAACGYECVAPEQPMTAAEIKRARSSTPSATPDYDSEWVTAVVDRAA